MQYAIFFNELPPYPGAYALARERVGVRVVPGAIAPPHPHPLPLEGARERHDAQKLNDRGCG